MSSKTSKVFVAAILCVVIVRGTKGPKASTEEKGMIQVPTFSWNAAEGKDRPWGAFEFVTKRIAYVLMDTELDPETGKIEYEKDTAVFSRQFALAGVPLRNQVNRLRIESAESPVLIALRCTDAFGEVLIDLRPTDGKATACSNTINRMMKGGFSHSSPMPEETMIEPIGQFGFEPLGPGIHEVELTAIEQSIRIAIDGDRIVSFEDPDVAGGRLGIGTSGTIKVLSFEQQEMVTPEEQKRREEFVRRMEEFGRELDQEYEIDIARNNDLSIKGDALKWTFPETGARVVLQTEAGALHGTLNPGLYGDATLLDGNFAQPEIIAADGKTYRLSPKKKPTLEGDETHLRISLSLESDGGSESVLTVLAKFTENATWFWTAEVEGINVREAKLLFSLDQAFAPNRNTTEFSERMLVTDAVVGHYWQRISGQDIEVAVQQAESAPVLVVRSERAKFRWATMWLPMHKMILTGYEKRMLHFIRYPQTPVQEWRERPSKNEYPTDEELQRFALEGVNAMVWHHTWTSNSFRKRDGFVVNETEMRRAMKKAHELGIAVIPYIGIVPGRHPVLRYQDLAGPYEKNWDLQDFTSYSVAGRWFDFFPYMTDYWCREYGIDGFYVDGGLAGLTWGFTGLSEEDFDGLTLEELNDRFYSRVKRVLRRNHAGFGLENWGGDAIKLAAPFYDCRMIGESFQEAKPETYREKYNPLLTGTPFKMYGMDLQARNRYNVAMAAVCLTDIQICSGNHAWGNWPDRPSDWQNLRPFWEILDGIDWDAIIDAKPWWAQTLIEGDGFYAGNYTTKDRAVVFLANKGEEWGHVTATVNKGELPPAVRDGTFRRIYPEMGGANPLGDGLIDTDLPPLHHGPVGFEIVAGRD